MHDSFYEIGFASLQDKKKRPQEGGGEVETCNLNPIWSTAWELKTYWMVLNISKYSFHNTVYRYPSLYIKHMLWYDEYF
jgi:hypothetical protein